MKKFIIGFLRDEEGANVIEYGLIAGLIAVAIIAFMPGFTAALAALFGGLTDALTAATP